MIIKVLGVGIVTIIINIILKEYKSDFAVLANICGGLIIFMLCINAFDGLIDGFLAIESIANVKFNMVKPIIKVISIGYVTEFTADLAEDSGNKSIADKIIVGGKIAICLMAMPMVKTMISAIISLI